MRCSTMLLGWWAAAAASACALRSPHPAASPTMRRATAWAPCMPTSLAAAVRPCPCERKAHGRAVAALLQAGWDAWLVSRSTLHTAFSPSGLRCMMYTQGGSCSGLHVMPARHASFLTKVACAAGEGVRAGRRRKEGSVAQNGAIQGGTDDEADPDEGGGASSGEEEEDEEEGPGEDASEEDTDEGEGEDAGAAAGPGAASRGGAAGAALSTHERRLARMAARIARMEEENMGEREWFLRGEAGAGAPL